MTSAKKTDNRIFTFEVKLLDGLMTEEFVKTNKKVTRTVELKASQTLDHLHKIIFTAFDHFDPHLYEFEIGGKGPMDRIAQRYVLPLVMEERDPFSLFEEKLINLKTTKIATLDLTEEQSFFYWFDYGDDWWHAITLKSIADKPEAGVKYPRITARVGESPPQYIEWDE
jgi:hypothetical protein